MHKENVRHKKFASLVAAGMSPGKAYRAAGYSAKSDDSARACASRLLRNASGVAESVLEQKPKADARFAAELAKVTTRPIEGRAFRVRELALMYQGMREVIAARAKAVEMRDVAGGHTGLLSVRFRHVGKKMSIAAKSGAILAGEREPWCGLRDGLLQG